MKEYIVRLVIVLGIAFVVYQFGIKPMMNDGIDYTPPSASRDWAASSLKSENGIYDVIVIGEEPEGIAAAVSAARAGAKTLLVSQSNTLGGVVTNSLFVSLQSNYGEKEKLLNRGIFLELHDKLKDSFSVDKFSTVVSNMVKSERNLDIIYNGSIDSPILKDNILTGVKITVDNKSKIIQGKRFIDATQEGVLLLKCGVPYFSGSEDLNIKQNFSPVKLNFILSNVNWGNINKQLNSNNIAGFLFKALKYEPSDMNIRITDFNIIDQGNNKVIIQGIEVYNLNVLDAKSVSKAYSNAISEAKEFTRFLSKEFKEFEGAKFEKAAGSFYFRELRHFSGEHKLEVNEIMDNSDFADKIALSSRSIDGSKLVEDGSQYIIGKPVEYSIPLGCIIPVKIDNLLMVGNKVSYSSLAATSAANMATNINIGESAGIISVYSIVKDITPRDIVKHKYQRQLDDIERLLVRHNVYPSDLKSFKIKNINSNEWSYPAIKGLMGLGLIAGGTDNDFSLKSDTRQNDLATLLLNGTYRFTPDKYSLTFDARIRPYLFSDKLSPAKAAEILLAFHGVKAPTNNAYSKACALGYIDSSVQLRVKNKKILAMEDVLYLVWYNLKLLANK
jgi:hypothetical protein